MTTYAQLDKFAKSEFIPNMQERGFKHYKSFIFARENSSGVRNILHSQILSSRENVRIWAFVWVPEFDANKPSAVYPKDVSIKASFPTWECEEWHDLWGIKEEADCRKFFACFTSILDKHVIPWFDSIKTGHDLVNVLNPGAIKVQDRQPVIQRILQTYI